MTCHEPPRLPFPSEPEIWSAPERAILALLDANLVLAARTLNAQWAHYDECEAPHAAALLLTARSIVAMAGSMRLLLAGYDDAGECLTRIDHTRATPDTDDDLF